MLYLRLLRFAYLLTDVSRRPIRIVEQSIRTKVYPTQDDGGQHPAAIKSDRCRSRQFVLRTSVLCCRLNINPFCSSRMFTYHRPVFVTEFTLFSQPKPRSTSYIHHDDNQDLANIPSVVHAAIVIFLFGT